MVFKSLPRTHWNTIFLAALVTAYPLVKWELGRANLRASTFLFPLVFWAMVGFEALQRRHPSWQPSSAIGVFGPSPFLNSVPTLVKYGFWVFVLGAAVLIDLLVWPG